MYTVEFEEVKSLASEWYLILLYLSFVTFLLGDIFYDLQIATANNE